MENERGYSPEPHEGEEHQERSENPQGEIDRRDLSPEYQRFVGWMRRLSGAIIKSVDVVGEDNLDRNHLPEEAKIIFASSHLSDIDLETVIATLGNKFPMSITSLVTNQEHPLIGRAEEIAGRKYFLDIENTFEKGVPRSKLDTENMHAIENSLNEGRSVVIAAHNPTYNWQLPEHSGRAVPYVASETGAYVVPIAIDIHSEEPIGLSKLPNVGKAVLNAATRRKPNATVIIGEPMTFAPIPSEDLRLVDDLLSGDKRATLTPEDREKAKRVHQELMQRGDLVMERIAQSFPEKKRGVWNEKIERE